jgi:hypothetical protein
MRNIQFDDDGGTRAWRANQATWNPRVYEARRNGLRGWWQQSSPWRIFLTIIGGFAVFFLTLLLLLAVAVITDVRMH